MENVQKVVNGRRNVFDDDTFVLGTVGKTCNGKLVFHEHAVLTRDKAAVNGMSEDSMTIKIIYHKLRYLITMAKIRINSIITVMINIVEAFIKKLPS